jgi:hypothetical protein
MWDCHSLDPGSKSERPTNIPARALIPLLMMPNRVLSAVVSDSMDDIHHYDKKLANQARLLGETFPEEEKQLILSYARMLEARRLNKGRIAKAVFLLRELRRNLEGDFRGADATKIESLVIRINGNKRYGAWTHSDAKGLLKRFYRWPCFSKYEGKSLLSSNPNRIIQVKGIQSLTALVSYL